MNVKKVLRNCFVVLVLCFAAILVFCDFDMSALATSFGITNRYDTGYADGYDVGYLEGLEAGSDSGYKKGYHQGYNDGCDVTKALYDTIKSASSDPGDISKKTPNSSASSVTWVYVTDTGSKYHKAGCSYLKSSNEISLSDAIAWGYEPCSRCY